jgi:EAL domain-containing protein (putative c-di-GMP-specific phosphodiesterase class I)/CheY-like chemotaxis protein
VTAGGVIGTDRKGHAATVINEIVGPAGLGPRPAVSAAELRRAVAGDELVLHFQPQVSLGTDRLVGMEALVRWAHPRLGLLGPDTFIPVAEQGPEIVELGAWVLRQACAEAVWWRRAVPAGERLFVSVNVSALQFTSELIEVVSDALLATGCPAEALLLEVTETTAMSDPARTRDILEQLRDLGVQAAIDDFGTGYSSLAYLRRFPLHTLKVDRAFVDGLGVEPEDTAIVGAVVAMAHALGLAVVAEGVETSTQLEHLRVLGCDMAQGYYFERPLPPASAHTVVQRAASGEWRPAGGTTGDAPWSPAPLMPTVLVVDDSADMRVLTHTALATGGFAVREAENAVEGLAALKHLHPDCVVLDVDMPGMSGIDMLRHLRQDAGPGIAVIILTGSATFEAKAEAYALGADDYILKPISPRELVARVERVLHSRAAVPA